MYFCLMKWVGFFLAHFRLISNIKDGALNSWRLGPDNWICTPLLYRLVYAVVEAIGTPPILCQCG